MGLLSDIFKQFAPPKTYQYPAGDYSVLAQDIIESGYHCLIAGATGSGKSTLLNGIIYTMLAGVGAVQEIYMIDPKRVELSRYRDVPIVCKVATEPQEIIELLNGLSDVMEQRYKRMQKQGAQIYSGKPIYVIIDELADLMLYHKKEVAPVLQHLLQLGRAAKVYIIVCTQAPARKVIPAEVVLNINYKIALHCNNAIESRQIVGETGAELLPIYGYCLTLKPGKGIERQAVPIFKNEDIDARIRAWTSQ